MTVTASASPSNARPTPPATSRGLVELEDESSLDPPASLAMLDELETLGALAEDELAEDELVDDDDERDDDERDDDAADDRADVIDGSEVDGSEVGGSEVDGDGGVVGAAVLVAVGVSLVFGVVTGAVARGERLDVVAVADSLVDGLDEVDVPHPARGSDPAERPFEAVTKIARAADGALTRTVRLWPLPTLVTLGMTAPLVPVVKVNVCVSRSPFVRVTSVV